MAQPQFVPLSNLTLPYLREIDPRVATDLLQIMNTINRTGIPVPLEVAGTDDGGTTIIPLSVDASGHLNINIVSPVDSYGDLLIDHAITSTTFRSGGTAGAPATLHGSFSVTGLLGAEGTVGIAIMMWGNFGGACTGPNKLKLNIVAGQSGSGVIVYPCLFNGEVDTGPDPINGAYPTYEQFPIVYVNFPVGLSGIQGIAVDWSITLGPGAVTPAQIYYATVGIPTPFPATISASTTAGSVTQGTSPWVTKDAADGTPGAAIPATAIMAAGSDGTNLQPIKVDTSGRIILGVPSANLPVSIAAQSLSPIVVGGSVSVSNFPATQPVSTASNWPVTIAAQSLSPIVVSGSVTQGTSPWVVGGAAATGAVPVGNPVLVAGFDGTDVRDISTDTSGRIILGAPSANIPVSIAAQSLSPIIVRDSSDFTAGSAFGSGYMGIVGGIDSSGSARVLGMVGGPAVAVGAPNSLLVSAVDPGGLSRFLVVDRPGTASSVSAYPVSGTDGTNSRILSTDTSGRIILGAPSANLPVSIAAQSLSPIVTSDAADIAPGSAVPAKALYVAGTDGTNARGLSTDTSGRLILPPATNTATANTTISAVNSSANFGGTAAINAKYAIISGCLGGATVVTATMLFVQIATQAGIALATAAIYVPLTASIPSAGIPFNQVVTFNEGGFTVIANATAILKVVWVWLTAPTSVTSNVIAYCTVGY